MLPRRWEELRSDAIVIDPRRDRPDKRLLERFEMRLGRVWPRVEIALVSARTRKPLGGGMPCRLGRSGELDTSAMEQSSGAMQERWCSSAWRTDGLGRLQID
jgi:hypothetical protein